MFFKTLTRKILAVAVNLSQFKNQYIDIRLKGTLLDVEVNALRVEGSDAVSFLNNQLTNSLPVSEKTGVPQCILELNGKLNTYFYLYKEKPESFICFYLKTDQAQFLERLKRFHITEDVEFTELAGDFLIKWGSDQVGCEYPFWYCGISSGLVRKSPEIKADFSDDELRHLMGFPKEDALFTDTRYSEYCYDMNKGCFPGQETVAKISTRRGSAYYPVLVQPAVGKDLFTTEKKISKYISSHEGSDLHKLLRDYRIHQKKIVLKDDGEVEVLTFPIVAESDEESAQLLYETGLECFSNNDENKAMELLHAAIHLNPKHADAYESLGVIYGRQEKFKKAIELMEQLQKLEPKSVMACTNLSMYHMRLGNIETAEKYQADAMVLGFEKAGEEAAAKEKEQNAKKELERRMEMFQQVLEIDAQDQVANYGLADCLYEQGDFQAACQRLLKIIEGSKHSQSYLLLAKCFNEMNESEQAQQILATGIEVAAQNGDLVPLKQMQQLKNS